MLAMLLFVGLLYICFSFCYFGALLWISACNCGSCLLVLLLFVFVGLRFCWCVLVCCFGCVLLFALLFGFDLCFDLGDILLGV